MAILLPLGAGQPGIWLYSGMPKPPSVNTSINYFNYHQQLSAGTHSCQALGPLGRLENVKHTYPPPEFHYHYGAIVFADRQLGTFRKIGHG